MVFCPVMNSNLGLGAGKPVENGPQALAIAGTCRLDLHPRMGKRGTMAAMRFRKLRIAFSVTCLIACVLLIVFWVRSYSGAETVAYGHGSPNRIAVKDHSGSVRRVKVGRNLAGILVNGPQGYRQERSPSTVHSIESLQLHTPSLHSLPLPSATHS